jgi:DNA-directed RNA polymerase specialized sigma24 family protein
MSSKQLKKNWTIDTDAFQRLLDWFDAGKNSQGQRYLEIRGRLVSFFDRKNSLNPDDLADETLNRVSRRLTEEKIESETPEKFCYITAKFVFLESLRANHNRNIPIDEITENTLVTKDLDDKLAKEKMLDCLEHCTENLDYANREIIVGYYYGEERIKIANRKNLATKLGFSINALSIRACRIREKLHICVVKCAEKNNL